MGLKDLCWCTNSHHPCGPSTTVSTQLICTNLEHKPLSLFRLTAIYCHSTGKMVKNKDAIVNSNTIYPRSTWHSPFPTFCIVFNHSLVRKCCERVCNCCKGLPPFLIILFFFSLNLNSFSVFLWSSNVVRERVCQTQFV